MSKKKSNKPPKLPRIEVRVPEIHSTGKDDVPWAPLGKPLGGNLLRDVFTGQLTTRNPLYLTLLFLAALLFPLGLLLALLMVEQPDLTGFGTVQFWTAEMCGALPMMTAGLVALAALTSSMQRIRRARSSRRKGTR